MAFGWQERFWDSIIKDEESFVKISQYIINNPMNWEDDMFAKDEDFFPMRRRVAMVFQGSALFDSLNVYENIAYPLRELHGVAESEIEARVE